MTEVYTELLQENSELETKVLRLEQENKEIYENGQIEITKLCNEKTKYRSALEEIREIAAPRFVNGLNEEADLCNLAMDRIQNKINEVLQ